MRPVLMLCRMKVAYGARLVLSNLDFEVDGRGTTVLVGPAGTGKSTLLRSVCGFNERMPHMKISGRVIYNDRPASEDNCPYLVTQKPRSVLDTILEYLAGGLTRRSALTRQQQKNRIAGVLVAYDLDHLAGRQDERLIDLTPLDRRLLLVVRAIMEDPALICLDEPTVDLTDADTDRLLALIRRENERRAFLFVTHNQKHARMAGDSVALLANGRIMEHRPVTQFFDEPETRAARQFIRTGGCDLPQPGSPPEVLSHEFRPGVLPGDSGDRENYVPASRGPNGFCWLIGGVLAGAAQPGLLAPLDNDLVSLKRVGTTVLVSLTEEKVIADEILERHGIRSFRFPIPDMGSRNWMQSPPCALKSME